MIDINIISVNEAIKFRHYPFEEEENDKCELYGCITGYIMAFMIEVKKLNKISYSSIIFTNNCGAILLPDEDSCYNDLGIIAKKCISNGQYPTGNIIFRGYYKITKDKSGNIEYVRASNEVKKLMQNVDNS